MELCINQKEKGKNKNMSIEGYVDEGILNIRWIRNNNKGNPNSSSVKITKQELEAALAQMK